LIQGKGEFTITAGSSQTGYQTIQVKL
jgi:hypothetical protein